MCQLAVPVAGPPSLVKLHECMDFLFEEWLEMAQCKNAFNKFRLCFVQLLFGRHVVIAISKFMSDYERSYTILLIEKIIPHFQIQF